ncbi:MAG: hypothetical protein HQ464_12705 [Planctomycetes bacterium]|nr:hypothetical protein [Planctomycetota bacterium]
MSKTLLVTFADSGLQRSLHRIAAQAREMGQFSEVIAACEHDLDTVFRKRFASRLRPGSRGFGYWAWKPQIILQAFRSANQGDVVIYCDAGCHLNPGGQQRLDEYCCMARASKSGILAFQNKPWLGRPEENDLVLPDRAWTKGDVVDYFGVRDRPDVTDTGTIGAGIIVFKACHQSRTLLEEWLRVFETDFSLVDDTPSRSPNLPGFREHRHDQAVFSILCKLNDVATASAFEYWYPNLRNPRRADWRMLHDRPFWAVRDKDRGRVRNLIGFVTQAAKSLAARSSLLKQLSR